MRENEVLSDQGTWKTGAEVIARAEGVSLPGSASIMPPSFVALNNQVCLAHIKQMYDFLQKASWHTCVVCWRAWYSVDFSFDFIRASGKDGGSNKWYNPRESVILGARRKKNVNRWYIDSQDGLPELRRNAARKILECNFPEAVCESIWMRLVGKPWLAVHMKSF